MAGNPRVLELLEEMLDSGRTPEEVLRDVLSRTGDPVPSRSSVAARPRDLSKARLIAAMEEISVRSAARPLADPRSPEEIVGYDDFGCRDDRHRHVGANCDSRPRAGTNGFL